MSSLPWGTDCCSLCTCRCSRQGNRHLPAACIQHGPQGLRGEWQSIAFPSCSLSGIGRKGKPVILRQICGAFLVTEIRTFWGMCRHVNPSGPRNLLNRSKIFKNSYFLLRNFSKWGVFIVLMHLFLYKPKFTSLHLFVLKSSWLCSSHGVSRLEGIRLQVTSCAFVVFHCPLILRFSENIE